MLSTNDGIIATKALGAKISLFISFVTRMPPHSMLWPGMGTIPPISTTWRTSWSSTQWPLTTQ